MSWKTCYSTLFVLSSTLLFCEEEEALQPCDNASECCESFCCAINPSGRPFNPDYWGFYVTIDPLIWHANLNDGDVAVETTRSENFFNQTGNNRVKNLNFNWDWGFRLGVGFNSCHDGWDVVARWTRWKTDAKRNLSAPSGGALYPTRGVPAFIQDEFAQSLNAKWEMDYNILDVENGREFFVSNCLTLRPFAGVRTAWIKQEFDTLYNDLAPVGVPTPNNSHDVFQRDRFWGIGIRGGADIQWGIISGWSFFSNFAGNLLYGYHSVKQVEVTGPAGQESEFLNMSDFFHIVSAIFDMQLGIRWDIFFCCDTYHLGLDLGWELHWYPNQNQFFNFVDDLMVGKFTSNEGDLGIHGFYFRARFDF